MYQMGWILCFAVAVTFYFVVNLVLPPQVVPSRYDANAKCFEGFAETEGYLEGDALVESKHWRCRMERNRFQDLLASRWKRKSKCQS
jgi:hypothetical protein